MIDQLPTAVQQTAQSANTANRDRKQSAADKDDRGSFEDVVSKAGQHHTRQGKNKDGSDELEVKAETGSQRSADMRAKVTFEFSAALRGFGAPGQAQRQTQTQAQTPGEVQAQAQAQPHAQLKGVTKDAAKLAASLGKTGEHAETTLAKLAEKLKDAAKQAERIAEKTQVPVDDANMDQAMTPSDELGLLLGLTKETDARHGKKAADGGKAEKADSDGKDANDDKFVAKTDTGRIEHVAAMTDTRLAKHEPASDDESSRNDVVRLVSANGRGRSVDVDVSPASAETQRDTGKAANTPKVETATVLEARRYLGFSSQPNAATLATAIKADPTWTEALQAAQGSDLGTLGNTVTEVNTLKLQMNPENLGNMVATLKLKGEELTVELRVDSAEAYQQLSADHDDIIKGLRDQGFTIDKVTVQLNATDRTDTGADRDMARQGQAQRDAEAQQRDGQRNQSGRNNGGEREQPRWTPSGPSADGAAGGGGRNDPANAGNIYL